MSIAQIVYDNEKSFGYTDDDIHAKVNASLLNINVALFREAYTDLTDMGSNGRLYTYRCLRERAHVAWPPRFAPEGTHAV